MKYNKPFEVRLFDHRTGMVIRGYGQTKREAEAAAQRLWNEKFNAGRRRF